MSDIKLTEDGDWDLSSGGIEILGDDIDGIAQDIRIRFHSVEGDWFLNLSEGLPYFSRILIASPNEADLYSIYREEFAAVPGVLSKDKDLKLEKVSESILNVRTSLQTIYGPLANLVIPVDITV